MPAPKRLIFSLASLLLIALAAWQVFAQGESLEYGDSVEGMLGSNTQERWQFQGAADDIIQLELQHKNEGFISRLSLYNEQGELQTRIEHRSAIDPATLIFRLPDFGAYTLELLSLQGTTGEYGLSLGLVQSNQTQIRQSSLSFGETVTQLLQENVPYHIWTFDGEAGDIIDLRLSALQEGTAPTLSIFAPTEPNTAIDSISAADDSGEANLLALRLPVTGEYSVLAGFNNPQAAGNYQLSLNSRTNSALPPVEITIDEPQAGRLSPESPMMRYQLVQEGNFAVEVILSEASCLAQVTLREEGRGILTQFSGQSPLRYALRVPSILRLPQLDVTTTHCQTEGPIDYSLRMTPLAWDIPLYHLQLGQQVLGGDLNPVEQWFFRAAAGDTLKLELHNLDPTRSLPLRLYAPDRSIIYRADLYTSLQQQLTLRQDGLYILEVMAEGTDYHLRRSLAGIDYRLFEQQSPGWQENLDIEQPGEVWRIRVQGAADAALIVRDPAGKILAVQKGNSLGDTVLDPVMFPQSGRYRVELYGDEAPTSSQLTRQIRQPRILNTMVKDTLTQPLQTDRWQLPLQADVPVTLELTARPAQAPLPSLSVVDVFGLELAAEIQFVEENRLRLVNLLPRYSGVYTVLVTNSDSNNALTYNLRLETPLSSNPSASLAPLQAPAPENFAPITVRTPQPFISPPYDATLFEGLENAARLIPPRTARGEILPGQRREVWRVSIVRGETLAVTASSVSDAPAPGLAIFDSAGQLLHEHWEPAAPLNQLLYRVPQDNTYYVVVTASGEAGMQYLISASAISDLDPTLPMVEDALPIEVGEEQRGIFQAASNVLEYRFWGTDGDLLQFSLEPLSGPLRPQLNLEDPFGNEVTVLSLENGQATLSEPITLRQTGIYQLRATVDPATSEGTDGTSLFRFFIQMLAGRQSEGGILADSVTGMVGLSQYEDTWFFRARAGESVQFSLEPLSADGPSPLQLSLLDSAGNRFYFHQTELTVNQLSTTPMMLPRTGIYQVIVNGGQERTGSYRLSMQRDNRYLREGDKAIHYGESVEGLFSPGNVLDRWLFVGQAGDVVAVLLRPGLGDVLQPGFQLQDAAGNTLAVGIDAGNGTGARTEAIVLPQEGLYSIYVGAPQAEDTTGVYNLTLELQNRQQLSTQLPDLAYGEQVSSTLYAHDPVEFWLFEGQRGDTVTASLAGDGVLEPALAIIPYDAAYIDGQLTPLVIRTGAPDREARISDYMLPQDGAYILRVTGLSGTTGQYTLSLALQEAFARPLAQGERLEDRLIQGEPRRWQFQGQDSEVLSLEVTPVRRSQVALAVELYTAAGQLLVLSEAVPGEAVLLRYPLPANDLYTVVVREAFSLPAQRENRYTIALELTALPNPPQASRLLSYDENALGELSAVNPRTEWSFTGQAGDVISLEAQRLSGNLDPVLTLYTMEGEVLARADDQADGPDALLVYTLPENANYRLEIARFGGAEGISQGSYSLDLDLLYRPALAAFSPRQYLHYGERQNSTLERNGNGEGVTETWYFIGEAGDRISSAIQFLSRDNPLLFFIADGAGNRYQQAERIEDRAVLQDFELPVSGIYTLIVQAPQDIALSPFYPYSIALELNEGGSISPKDSLLLQAQSSVTGQFNEGERSHLWLYEGQAGEQLLLNLARLEGQQTPELLIFTPTGNLLRRVNAGMGDQQLALTLAEAGLYQILLFDHSNAAQTAYRLVLNTATLPHVIGTLAPDVPAEGILSDASPAHRWLLALPEDAASISVSAVASESLNLSLRLENAAGAVLLSSLPGERVSLPTTPIAGEEVYSLVVERAGGILSPDTGRYRVQISQSAPPEPILLTASPLLPDQRVGGTIDAATVDYYRFEVAANTPFSLEVIVNEGEGLPTLRVLSPQQQELLSQMGHLEDVVLFPGVYVLELSHPTPLAYQLRYVQRPNAAADAELREALRQVNLQGRLTPAQPVNYWQFQAQAGEFLTLDMATIGQQFRPDLVLFDPLGVPVHRYLQTEQTNQLQFGPLYIAQTGNYTLRLSTWMREVNSELRYTMRLVEDSANAASLDFPAGQLTTLAQPVTNVLNQQDPIDEWQFIAEGGSRFDIRVMPLLGEARLSLRLLDASGNVLAEHRAAAPRLADVQIPATGQYQLQLSLAEVATLPDNFVQVYQLQLRPLETALEASLSQAQVLSLDTDQAGQIGDDGAAQAWLFYAAAGTSVTLGAEASDPVLLRLFSPTGDLLQTVADHQEEALGLPLTGFYSVLVAADAGVEYSLRVEQVELLGLQEETLKPDLALSEILTNAVPVHSWALGEFRTGDYDIAVQPEDRNWLGRAFLLDTNAQVLVEGERQPDGTLLLNISLNEADAYRLVVQSGSLPEAYTVLLREDLAQFSPAFLTAAEAERGIINAANPIDEWLWRGREGQQLTITLEAEQPDSALQLRIFAPNNLFLRAVDADENGQIAVDSLALPLNGTYILQVISSEEVSNAPYTLELRLAENGGGEE